MILYFRGPCHISITAMTHPTLDPRPKTASDWRCPWQQLEPQLILPLSLCAVYLRASVSLPFDLVWLPQSRVEETCWSCTYFSPQAGEANRVQHCQCVSPETTHISKPNPTSPPTATPLAFRSNPHPHPPPHSTVGGRCTDLLVWKWDADTFTVISPPPIGLLMAPESTWPKQCRVSPT